VITDSDKDNKQSDVNPFAATPTKKPEAIAARQPLPNIVPRDIKGKGKAADQGPLGEIKESDEKAPKEQMLQKAIRESLQKARRKEGGLADNNGKGSGTDI
jgi:hypothetical protein